MTEPGPPLSAAERKRDAYLRKTYGIGLVEYAVLLTFQGGVCAVCHRPPKTRSLHVDHDHRTKKIRGLLCFTCNSLVVQRHRDPVILRAAASYIERPPADEAFLAL